MTGAPRPQPDAVPGATAAPPPPAAGHTGTGAPGPASAPPPLPPTAIEPPSPDVAPVGTESALPGTHRGGFERLPTAPLGVAPIVTAPDLDAPVQWAPVAAQPPSRGMSAWALTFGVVALVVSFFVGWGFPLGLVAIVTAIIALRRPIESRGVALWALVLGAVSLAYSAGWLIYAASREDLLALLG